MAVGLSYSAVWASSVLRRKPWDEPDRAPHTHLISAGAEAFLAPKEADIWSLDASTAAMSGFLRFRFQSLRCIFDTKLWLFFFADTDPVVIKSLVGPYESMSRMATPVAVSSSVLAALKVWSGLIYLAVTAVGSVSYLRLSTVNLANDLWWATYNTTGTQTFLSNWFNRYLFFNASQPATRLDLPVYADTTDYSPPNTRVSYALPYARLVQYESGRDLAMMIQGLRSMDASHDTLIAYSPNYARLVQYESGRDLTMMIQGLRSMDACNAPWIATSYCWLDFDRQIEMANTLGRQARCDAKYHSNGAVYLESILRNVDWPTFESCWGTSFEIGVAKDIGSLKPNGAAWLKSLTSGSSLSVVDEAKVWQSLGVLTYTTQWQNYKALGLHDVFSIENALGMMYDMTLQSTNGSYQSSMSTSWKTYWTFASDLWAIATNGSGIAGRSLLRPSAHFAFANTSLQSLMVLNSTLQTPLDGALRAFSDSIGPFGAVDMYHVQYPPSLAILVRDIREALGVILANTSSNAQEDYANLILMNSMSPVPRRLDRNMYLCASGNILCGQVPRDLNLSYGLLEFTGVDTMCHTSFNEWVSVSPMQAIVSVIGAGIPLDPTTLIPVACTAEAVALTQCLAFLDSVSTFVSRYLSTTVLQSYRSQALVVETDVLQTSVGVVQYVRHVPTNRVELFHQVLFDPSDATMTYTSYALAYDWVVGGREALSVQGDTSSMALLSAASYLATLAASSIEVPRNVAAYLRGLCQYVSFVLVALASVTALYALFGGSAGEGLNLFKINRVGGMIWVGRPLLLARSFTALSHAASSSRGVAALTQILAAGEVGWLVYIFDDICMPLTRELSAAYAFKASILTWFIVAALSFTNGL
ncbi:hypothetical protein SDRG_14868 [Saprolegnia diclina VS20]|uniref:Uncharacterized protein n=1 Tax=Saprolegnia diclina (strain VS20) TaxID=1156394 RepID=T0PPG8_SAPDV|nr:hypothetical protein SDRG_14868 [Saprolegnia diclina VS20]EQC27344.1 hypothetical protein SDRG_14868 [Saprolegnia diclina VS20]|eukprot:XP_008619248.1 hypothetical protein SDRG_14868 [Saprolegnia diclina VS20]